MGTMFFSDSTLWETIAKAQGIAGDQWGVMNELWNFPARSGYGCIRGCTRSPR